MIRFATLGTNITKSFVRCLNLVETGSLYASFSREKQRAQEILDLGNGEIAYDDYDALLKDEKVDVVYIGTPNHLHYEHANKALNAKKHVVCEKPMASNMKEVEALFACAEKNGVYLFDATTTTHLPNFKIIQEKLHEIGRIRMVQVNFSQYSSRYNALLAGEMPNVFNDQMSGGALYDLGVYNISFILGLFGMPKDVHYFADQLENSVDLGGIAILEYEDFKAVSMSRKDSYSKNYCLIQGEKGAIIVESESSQIATVVFSQNKQESAIGVKQNPVMCYEIADFIRIIETKDQEAYEKQKAFAMQVNTIMEACRKDANIVFAADKR